MKITDTKALSLQHTGTERAGTKGRANAPEAVASATSATTGAPGSLAALGASLAAEPSFDAARVESIKQAIRDGKLTINPEAIADKLLSSVDELLRKPH